MTTEPSLFVSRTPATHIGSVNVAWTLQGVVAVEIGSGLDAFIAWLGKRLRVTPALVDTGNIPCQIQEYLSGERTAFELEIDWRLITPFQRQVLELQLAIPYGEKRTYGQLAAQLGKPRAARAVGRAGATNPIPLIIPCHRVVGSDGSLRGYGAPGGIQIKAWLLALEKQVKNEKRRTG